jgi:hypothetical protein
MFHISWNVIFSFVSLLESASNCSFNWHVELLGTYWFMGLSKGHKKIVYIYYRGRAS